MGYIKIIITGCLVFPFIAAVFTLPYAVYQYNRHGSVSKYRTLIIYSYILYMLIGFFLVSLPLPDRASTVGNTWRGHLNLIPFKQIWLYWHNKPFGIATLKAYLVSMSLWQLLFNILLTVPFGVYMRYYFKIFGQGFSVIQSPRGIALLFLLLYLYPLFLLLYLYPLILLFLLCANKRLRMCVLCDILYV